MFLTILSDGSLSDEPYSVLPDTKPFSPWVKHQGEIFMPISLNSSLVRRV